MPAGWGERQAGAQLPAAHVVDGQRERRLFGPVDVASPDKSEGVDQAFHEKDKQTRRTLCSNSF